MEWNIVILSGRLAAAPELRDLDSGARLVRYLVTVRSDQPRRRVDVVPVILWDPPDSVLMPEPAAGQRIWVAGSVQRRFWQADGRRRSRVEIVAAHICLREEPDVEPFVGPPNGQTASEA